MPGTAGQALIQADRGRTFRRWCDHSASSRAATHGSQSAARARLYHHSANGWSSRNWKVSQRVVCGYGRAALSGRLFGPIVFAGMLFEFWCVCCIIDHACAHFSHETYIPPPRPEIVLRPRLIARLNEGLRGQADPHLCPRRLRQDHPGQRWLAGCGPYRPPGCRWTKAITTPPAFWPTSSRLCRRLAERWRERAGGAPIPAAAANRIGADGPAQRDRRLPESSSSSSTTTTSLMPSRSTRPWPFCSNTCRRRCTWSSPPARIRRCRWPGCAPGAN